MYIIRNTLYVIVHIISVKNTFTIYIYIFVFSRMYILDTQSIIYAIAVLTHYNIVCNK